MADRILENCDFAEHEIGKSAFGLTALGLASFGVPTLTERLLCKLDGNKNNLRTVEAQIVQKLKNNEARPKFTGSYGKTERVRLI